MTNLNHQLELPEMLSVRDLLEALIIIEARRQAIPPPAPLTAASLSSSTITAATTSTTTHNHAVPSISDDNYDNLSGSQLIFAYNDGTESASINTTAPAIANTNNTATTIAVAVDGTVPVTIEPIPLLPLANYIRVPESLDVSAEQWYVVSKGTSVGVFYDWNYVSPLVTGQRGAVYTKASSFANACLAFARNYEMGKVSIIT